jgi:hypothetical protein
MIVEVGEEIKMDDEDAFEWGEDIEDLLSKYCVEAMIREKMHRLSFYKQRSRSRCYALPIIILSTLSGSVQLLSSQFPLIEQHIIIGTATISIFTAILGSISAYLKLDEKKAKNLESQMTWQNFHNKIAHVLGLAPHKRPVAKEFLTKIHQDYDRLFEISPICSADITKKVKSVLGNVGDHFVIPNYLNGFTAPLIFGRVNAEVQVV